MATRQPARRAAPVAAAPRPTIRVRMYRVGFGDCFLLSLPVDGANGVAGLRHVLVDCGVHAQGDIDTMERVVENIAQETNQQLALVIGTHLHQDHLSGFGTYADKFSRFTVGEVWLPWTLNPTNPAAAKLQRKAATLVAQLQEHFARLAATNHRQEAAEFAVANLAGNQKALELLRSGFRSNARVRYLQAGDRLPAATDADGTAEAGAAGIPGLAVRVLGPPEDTQFLARMDPPAGQRYLRATDDSGQPSGNAVWPFPPKWRIGLGGEDDQLRRTLLAEGSLLGDNALKELDEVIERPSLDDLAFSIDQARNNESLVTLFTFRGQSLLFPGDAQWGNWQYWLQQDDADSILQQVTFFKLAHHGSLNATPRDALDKMTQGAFAAMVSTQDVPWSSIPYLKIVQRLREQTGARYVRSDWLKVAEAPDAPQATADDPAPEQFPDGFTPGPFWCDYTLPL